MKKIICLLLIVVMLFSCVAYASEYITMYSLDGRQVYVSSSEVDAYKSLGWYDNFADVEKVTMYSIDGREIQVAKVSVPTYKTLGWHETKIDAQPVTMYAIDGREIVVSSLDVQQYQNLGWYKNKSDIESVTLYSVDGQEIQVFRFQVEAYKNVGWYENKSDVMSVMCNRNGEKISVYKFQVQSYIAAGWIPQQSSYIDPSKPMVALTFDDGPKASTTGKILDVMEFYNTRATFFVLGNLAAGNTTTLQRMNSLNCQIGNHSYSHPNLASLSSYNISQQINQTSGIVYSAIGKYPTVVRPPYGSYNKNTLSAAGKPFILWSIDTLDWKYRNATSVYKAAVKNVRDGDIILMHDIYSSTATAVESIVPDLLLRGFQIVTIDEMAAYKNKPLTENMVYNSMR